jgi:uncharacterized protein YjbI with pentapeptide repeats
MFKHLSNLSNRAVLGILIAVALASSGLSLVVNIVNNVDTSPAWWVSWLQNFSTEMFGAFLTFILIELIVGGREKRRGEEQSIEQEKKRLIRQMGSQINAEAIRASEELKSREWLYDGSLRKQSFQYANLENAVLSNVKIPQVNLFFANLHSAFLDYADIQGASLREANLSDAMIPEANLQHSDLSLANLKSAFMLKVNLQNARLWKTELGNAFLTDCDMKNADIKHAIFDEHTTLPDGTTWTTDTDLRRFTDPNHPNFWRSDDPASPAYRGKNNSE